jgi:hypothetical protein
MSQEFADAIQDETIDTDPPPPAERDTYLELVEVSLSEEDRDEKRKQLEGVDREIIRLEEQKKAEAKAVNNQLKPLKARRECILADLDAGTEKRQLECYEHPVTSPAGVLLHFEIRRVDTDEKVDERAATADEQEENRQPGLFASAGSSNPPPLPDGVSDEDEETFEPTPEALAQAAEDEGRVVKTNSAEARKKRASKKNGAAETSEA